VGGLPHVGALAVIAVASAALALAARRWPGRWTDAVRVGLGVLLVTAEASWVVVLVREPWRVGVNGLPLEICDANVVVTAAALWWRRPALVEVSWFWGLAGGIPALLTPVPGGDFPGWLYFQYFFVHGGLVVAPLLLVVGLGLAPRRGAVWRALAVTAAYAAVMAVVDSLTGLNALYLRDYPPGPPTLLNLLGPWPWYLIAVAALAVVLCVLLFAPFRGGAARGGGRGPGSRGAARS
jgi:hypothetical integral membrane protein (TIGR02206 family)